MFSMSLLQCADSASRASSTLPQTLPQAWVGSAANACLHELNGIRFADAVLASNIEAALSAMSQLDDASRACEAATL